MTGTNELNILTNNDGTLAKFYGHCQIHCTTKPTKGNVVMFCAKTNYKIPNWHGQSGVPLFFSGSVIPITTATRYASDRGWVSTTIGKTGTVAFFACIINNDFSQTNAVQNYDCVWVPFLHILNSPSGKWIGV